MATVAASSGARGVTLPTPRWVQAVTLPLALVGLGIATYLTIEHFTGTTSLVCTSGTFNCVKVTTSPESEFLGLIPVAVLGLFQYVVMTALCTPWAWRSTNRLVHLARFAFAVVGMGFVLWLILAEFVLIHAVCEWCSGVHLITFALFVCIVRTVPTMLGWTER